jgi:hypothetical protein
MDNNINTIILSTSLIHKTFEYIDDNLKLLIHREGRTDEERARRIPIKTILNSRLEDYFSDVLLGERFIDNLCNICGRLGLLDSLKWAPMELPDMPWCS